MNRTTIRVERLWRQQIALVLYLLYEYTIYAFLTKISRDNDIGPTYFGTVSAYELWANITLTAADVLFVLFNMKIKFK